MKTIRLLWRSPSFHGLPGVPSNTACTPCSVHAALVSPGMNLEVSLQILPLALVRVYSNAGGVSLLPPKKAGQQKQEILVLESESKRG